jgi:hypothetical protein
MVIYAQELSTEKLKAPVTLLGASNEAHIKDAIPENIGGGFVARTFIIYADKEIRYQSINI